MAGEDVMDMKVPVGLHVLIVDDNPTCLKILQRLLSQCDYIVTITTEAVLALQMLRENKGKYDIVISDVHMPRMNGLDLLENIGLELDIPVIMLSANDDPRLVMKGVKHGAVDYLLKPVRLEELRNIWQHVVRRKQLIKKKGKAPMNDFEGEQNLREATDSVLPDEGTTKKRKDKVTQDDDVGEGQEDERGSESTDLASQKKARVVWSPELHQKFVNAVSQLGADRAFPKKILDHMNVEGLTRENVASHLQKYRLYLRRMNSDPTTMPFGLHGSSLYLNGGGPMFNPFAGMLGHLPGAASYRGVLSQSASNLVSSLAQSINVGRLQNQMAPLGMSPFGLQSRDGLVNQAPVVAPVVAPPPVAMPQGGTPQLADYSRRLEMWQNATTERAPAAQPTPPSNNQIARAQAAQPTPPSNNQITAGSYNPGFNGADISYLQSALARYTIHSPSAPLGGLNVPVVGGQDALGAQNVGFNVPVEPPMWPDQVLGGANPVNVFNSMPLAPAVASSSRVFGAESPPRVSNPLLDFQDSDIEQYLINEPDLQLDFDDNDGGSLEDIVKGLPQ